MASHQGHSLWELYSINRTDRTMVKRVKEFSADKKNGSLEFNDFLKMMAAEEERDWKAPYSSLLDAFR